jgi:hypothetical protein
MDGIFNGATSLTSCNKREIVDAWNNSIAFKTTPYDTEWATDTCKDRMNDTMFKEATWGTLLRMLCETY